MHALVNVHIYVRPGDLIYLQIRKGVWYEPSMKLHKRVGSEQITDRFDRSSGEITRPEAVNATGGLWHAFKAIEQVKPALLPNVFLQRLRRQQCRAAPEDSALNEIALVVHRLLKRLPEHIAAFTAHKGKRLKLTVYALECLIALPRRIKRLIQV